MLVRDGISLLVEHVGLGSGKQAVVEFLEERQEPLLPGQAGAVVGGGQAIFGIAERWPTARGPAPGAADRLVQLLARAACSCRPTSPSSSRALSATRLSRSGGRIAPSTVMVLKRSAVSHGQDTAGRRTKTPRRSGSPAAGCGGWSLWPSRPRGRGGGRQAVRRRECRPLLELRLDRGHARVVEHTPKEVAGAVRVHVADGMAASSASASCWDSHSAV